MRLEAAIILSGNLVLYLRLSKIVSTLILVFMGIIVQLEMNSFIMFSSSFDIFENPNSSSSVITEIYNSFPYKNVESVSSPFSK